MRRRHLRGVAFRLDVQRRLHSERLREHAVGELRGGQLLQRGRVDDGERGRDGDRLGQRNASRFADWRAVAELDRVRLTDALARTDRVRSIAEARKVPVSEVRMPQGDGGRALVATGKLADFRCCFARIAEQGEGLMLDPAAAEALQVGTGDSVWHAPR